MSNMRISDSPHLIKKPGNIHQSLIRIFKPFAAIESSKILFSLAIKNDTLNTTFVFDTIVLGNKSLV